MRIPRDFVHLRSRSPYSLLEGAIKMGEVAKQCQKFGQPALALTDTNNLCGALEFSEKMSGAGVQPIMGLTLSIDLEGERQPGQIHKDPDGTIVLLAQNEIGYGHLMKLSSAAFLDVDPAESSHVKASRLGDHCEGVICLTGGPDGALDRLLLEGRTKEAALWLDRLQDWFGDRLYIELQRHDTPNEAIVEPQLIDLAYDRNLPLVATNEPYFLEPTMHKAHDALLAISEGSYVLEPDRRKVSPAHYFKSTEQMIGIFEDLPEAIHNTLIIAKRCAYRSPKRDPILPNFGDGSTSEADQLAQLAKDGLEARLAKIEAVAPREDYFDRLDFELGIITNMGFPGYFLIVADFIQWAKAQDIPVGPGRGSGAGSVVAWALTITDLDPLRYGLLFERFLNPERVSMPDFDIDFCQERRGEVINYVKDKYGYDRVAQIITFGTLQSRAVVRDVGRVMQMPIGQVDRLAKMVISNPANPVSLQEAIDMEPRLKEARDTEPAVRNLLNTALQLEGLYRNASTHAAGVVIGDRPLQELIPLYIDPRSDLPATQFSMKWAEKAGMVKFDFLGLKTLTVIDRALKLIRKRGIDVDLDSVDMETPEAYVQMGRGNTAGLFQLESAGMRDALRKLKPGSIEELTAIISLYRPGPMRNIPTYIDGKMDPTTVKYPHPKLEDLLRETYGVIIYQEQVMEIAKTLSGFTLADADMLRRAMGKKDQAEMNRQKSKFIDGAVERDVDQGDASRIFDLVNEFAGYGFNKSHAAAYAWISFRTAYLKALYPVEFMAAAMSLDLGNVEKLAMFVQECRRIDVEVQPPCINRSQADFDVADGKVLYALGALKNVGLEAMKHVVSVREADGPFQSVHDFVRRVDMRQVNKRAIENLARSGAFDCVEPNRAAVLASAGLLQKIGTRAVQERESAQVSLFGEADEAMADPDLIDAYPWAGTEKLDHELGAIGFYMSGHPMDEHKARFEALKAVPVGDAEDALAGGQSDMQIAGIVRKRQEKMGKRGPFAFVSLSDHSGAIEFIVQDEMLTSNRDLLSPGQLITFRARVEAGDNGLKFNIYKLQPFYAPGSGRASHTGGGAQNTAAKPGPKGLSIRLRNADIETLDELKATLENLKRAPHNHQGYIELIAPISETREAAWRLQGEWAVDENIQKVLKSNTRVELVTAIAA